MESKNLIRSALTGRGRSGRFNRATSRRGIKLAPLLLVAVMLAAVAVLAETSNPSRTAHAHDDGTHTHRCTSPPAASCPTYDDVPAEITVWSATLTAGRIGANNLGYRSDPIGSLSDTTLSYGGTNYTIDQFSIGFGLLQFSLSSELASTPTNLN